MYTIVYFSPTGNALHLAERLASKLGEKQTTLLPLEFTTTASLKPSNQLILLYPIHGFNAPRTVKRFVRTLPKGLYDNVSLIAVGCNTTWLNGAVSWDLRKVLEAKDYQIGVDEVLAMPLTFIMPFPDDAASAAINASCQSIDALSLAILQGEQTYPSPH